MSFPCADLTLFASGSEPARVEQAEIAASSLIQYGCVLVRTELLEAENEAFLDMLEDYFALEREEILKDTRPELGYQVGATLEGTEKPRCAADADCTALIATLEPAERPLDLKAEHTDPKARFFWRMSEHPPETAFATLNAPNVVPERFKGIWEGRMNRWGSRMKQGVAGVAQMLAVGLGLPANAFTDHARYGAHLLAPTATNLEKYGNVGDIFAGFHSDLGCLTIHGRSRYPGLSVWARNTGKRIEVKVPPGCLLVQAGKQLEHVTGGLILAGFHEVACTEATVAAIERAKRERPGRPLIRISSTFFYHLDSDYVLDAKSLGPLKPPRGTLALSNPDRYPPETVGAQMERELKHIALLATA